MVVKNGLDKALTILPNSFDQILLDLEWFVVAEWFLGVHCSHYRSDDRISHRRARCKWLGMLRVALMYAVSGLQASSIRPVSGSGGDGAEHSL